MNRSTRLVRRNQTARFLAKSETIINLCHFQSIPWAARGSPQPELRSDELRLFRLQPGPQCPVPEGYPGGAETVEEDALHVFQDNSQTRIHQAESSALLG